MATTTGNLSPTTVSALQALEPVLGEFNQERANSIMESVKGEHSDTSGKYYNNYVMSDNAANSMAYYYSRNQDLLGVQQSVLDRVSADAMGVKHDAELLKRQFEINEWTANNKRESLFLMQLLLVAVTFTAFLLFLNRRGIVPNFIFFLVSTILFIAFILTIVIRAQYTNIRRDKRYWNRQAFPRMPSAPAPQGCPTDTNASPATVGSALNNLGTSLYGAATTTVGAGVSGLNKLGSSASTFANNYENTGRALINSLN
jgi:hypothetical protein